MEGFQNSFIQKLVFKKEGDKKVASFTDKFNDNSIVETEFVGLIPGMRYSCKLYSKPESVDPKKYFMVNYRIIEDDIMIVHDKTKFTVDVHLDGKIVTALSYDPSVNSDYEQNVKDLIDYFRFKTFQLANRQDIDKFVKYYEDLSKQYYDKYKNSLIKKVKK